MKIARYAPKIYVLLNFALSKSKAHFILSEGWGYLHKLCRYESLSNKTSILINMTSFLIM